MPDAPHPDWLKAGADFITLEILARPASQRRGLLRVESRGLVIGVGAPAEKGAANDELLATVAKLAAVARGEVSILRGAGTRSKVFRITTAQPSAIARRLVTLAAQAK